MFFPADATIENMSIHHVGNKSMDEFYILSESVQTIENNNKQLLENYLLKPFSSCKEVYNLQATNENLALNEVYHFADLFFKNSISLHALSEELAKHLYDITVHPKIKSGELIVVHFKNVMMEGEEHDAIGLFKIETKGISLKINVSEHRQSMHFYDDIVNLEAIDKATIIINKGRDEGYSLLIPKITSGTDRTYWFDDFLRVIPRNDSNLKTSNFLKVYKNFITEKLDDVFELDVADKAELLNNGLKYFKVKESFDREEFTQDVLGGEYVIAVFEDYLSSVLEVTEIPIPEAFEISNIAVKKAQSSYKSVVKLDKNFHLHIHGERELLDKGFDEGKGMNYYKVYFEQES